MITLSRRRWNGVILVLLSKAGSISYQISMKVSTTRIPRSVAGSGNFGQMETEIVLFCESGPGGEEAMAWFDLKYSPDSLKIQTSPYSLIESFPVS
jgi:hypothetical protein